MQRKNTYKKIVVVFLLLLFNIIMTYYMTLDSVQELFNTDEDMQMLSDYIDIELFLIIGLILIKVFGLFITPNIIIVGLKIKKFKYSLIDLMILYSVINILITIIDNVFPPVFYYIFTIVIVLSLVFVFQKKKYAYNTISYLIISTILLLDYVIDFISRAISGPV